MVLFEFMLPGAPWVFWVFYSCLSAKWGSFQPLFLRVFPLPLALFCFWSLYNVYVGRLDVSCDSLTTPFTSIQSFFLLFLRFNTFHCPVFKFGDSSACSNFPLNCSSECFISVIILFNSSVSFCFLFLSRYWYFDSFHTLFSWLSLHLSLVVFFFFFFSIFRQLF